MAGFKKREVETDKWLLNLRECVNHAPCFLRQIEANKNNKKLKGIIRSVVLLR